MVIKQINNAFEELWTLLRGEFDIPDTDDTPAIVEESQGRLPPENTETKRTDEQQKCETETSVSKLPRPLDANAKQKLEDIRRLAKGTSDRKKQEINSLIAILNEAYPGNESAIDSAVSAGKQDMELINQAANLGKRNAGKSEFTKLVQTVEPETRRLISGAMFFTYNQGLKTAKRYEFEKEQKKNGQTFSNVKLPTRSNVGRTELPKASLTNKPDSISSNTSSSLHPNDVRGLESADEWILVIDETGDQFGEEAENAPAGNIGKFAGVLIPESRTSLVPLDGKWHAVDVVDPVEIDHVFQSILDANVGVFGVDVRSVPLSTGERWMDGVTLLIDWVLRLMPVKERCKLTVYIENRAAFKRGISWDVARRECIRRLALAFPERAMKIDLSIDTTSKADTNYNGYADAIAFTWKQTNQCSKARLKQSGLLGTCLLDADHGADARSMLHAWDAFSQGVNLPSENWWKMLGSPDSRNSSALLSHLLTLVGNESKSDAKVWLPYLQEVKNRMAYGPIELKIMAPAIDWLQQYCPPDAQILPAMRLVWLTVQLARANHQGEVENRWQQELQQLGDRLFEEAAPLVCHAELHLAVNYTNRYEFAEASKSLARWQDVPPAVPSLRFWTHVQSSLGQHAAFTDDNAKAVMYFKTAMEAMQRLSDPEAKAKDLSQTGTYLAIAAMDDPATADDEVRHYVEKITGPLPEAAGRLAASGESAERYAHHLLLRWLTHRGDAASKAAYLAKRADWQSGPDHPWPLIELYRGMLLRVTEPESARDLALKAADIAFGSRLGPTVHLIGACCRLIAMQWGADWQDAESKLNALKQALPDAVDRIAKLQIPTQTRPLMLLNSVLPFNFR